MSRKSWILDVKQAGEDFFIELNEEILHGSGFKIGDELDWKDNGDGSFTLTKKKDTVWVMVETVQTFHHRYCIETPKDHPEYALDDVTCERAKEFSQNYVGEQIISHRVVTEEEALKLSDESNTYSADWDKDKKIKAFFTKDKK